MHLWIDRWTAGRPDGFHADSYIPGGGDGGVGVGSG